MMGDLDFDVVARTWPYLLTGLRYTLQLTVVAAVGGTIFGTLLAMARLSHFKPLSMVAAGYVNLMRSIPLLLVIFWFYFLVPVVLQSIMGAERPIQLGADRSAYITFIMFEAAYFCEIMRAGIQSIPKGQVNAAYALGLTYRQSMQLVILPQAFRNMLPILLTQTIVLFQDVSLVSLLNVTDFVGASVKIAQRDSRVVEMYLFVAIIYFALCFVLSTLVKRLQKRIAIIR
ncbi:amino acid ABC transporter permease [Noviherbaspirillum denitrificans]|uniref:Glutamate/aspartate import permease protein GltK n=1 Tax=Noviherbaspirillum denitrificans TaxID=1968433 RepID=A0A254TI94_9BURK|nr:amino acid ABC transporter permease [Noviherbaspirillum denitrificans]OWW21927.1 amino acid ABC transporter permease [Noviherbaspirillum denitrificans]